MSGKDGKNYLDKQKGNLILSSDDVDELINLTE